MAQEYGKVSGLAEHHKFMAKHHSGMAAMHEKAAAQHQKMAGGESEEEPDMMDAEEEPDTVQNSMPGKLPMSFGRGAR